MKIFNNYLGTLRHLCDRIPTTKEELKFLCEMFPECVVKRKTTGKSASLSAVKIKNLHWYE